MSDDDNDDYRYNDDSDIEDPNMGDDEEIELENSSVTCEDIMSDQPEEALKGYIELIQKERAFMEKNNKLNDLKNYKFSFKSIKNIILLLCQLQRHSEIHDYIIQLLKFMNYVYRNDATDAINKIIERLMELENSQAQEKILMTILQYLKQDKQLDQLWSSASLKLCKIYFDDKKFSLLKDVLQELKLSFRNDDGTDNVKKSSQLLEIYSYEIQLAIIGKQPGLLKETYKKTQNLQSAINDSRIMGIIKETSGKMLMMEKKYEEATNELMEAFKGYQEVGDSQAKAVLKYVTLASILSRSSINPFDNKEAKVYKDEAEILAMQNLRYAYETKNIKDFNKIINLKEAHIKDDEFMQDFIQELKKVICMDKITSVIIPYTKIKLSYLAAVLQCDLETIERYLMEMIVDTRIQGFIDADEGYFENLQASRDQLDVEKQNSLVKWLASIKNI